MSAKLRALADRYNEWIDRHDIAWELVMAMLAVAFVIDGLLLDGAEDNGGPVAALWAIDIGLTVVFVAEFTTRLLAARSRLAYLRGHWIDAIALVPTVRGVRLLRLLRLLRLVRAFAGTYRALMDLQRFARHRGLVTLFVAWLGVAFISGAAFYLAEAPHLSSPFDAVWWAVVTLTTVGYGDIAPTTVEGRIAGIALMIVGVTLWAAITGTITSLLISGQSANASIPDKIRQLDELRRDELLSDEQFAAKRDELLARMR